MYTAEIRSKLLGSPERECSKIAVEEMKLPMSVDKFQLEFRRLAHSYMASVSLMPGNFDKENNYLTLGDILIIE